MFGSEEHLGQIITGFKKNCMHVIYYINGLIATKVDSTH